jgi:hypothetical protein
MPPPASRRLYDESNARAIAIDRRQHREEFDRVSDAVQVHRNQLPARSYARTDDIRVSLRAMSGEHRHAKHYEKNRRGVNPEPDDRSAIYAEAPGSPQAKVHRNTEPIGLDRQART